MLSNCNWLLTVANNGLLPRGGSRILFFYKDMGVCIAPPVLYGPLSLRIAWNISRFLWPKNSIRGTREALFTGSYTHPLSNVHWSGKKSLIDLFLRNSTQGSLSLVHYWKIMMQRPCIWCKDHASNLANNTDLHLSFCLFSFSDIPHCHSKKL